MPKELFTVTRREPTVTNLFVYYSEDPDSEWTTVKDNAKTWASRREAEKAMRQLYKAGAFPNSLRVRPLSLTPTAELVG